MLAIIPLVEGKDPVEITVKHKYFRSGSQRLPVRRTELANIFTCATLHRPAGKKVEFVGKLDCKKG
jgi:hypothetical protein